MSMRMGEMLLLDLPVEFEKNKPSVYNKRIMERGLIMYLHAIIIGLILYILMVYLLGQKTAVAEDRSILIAAVVLIYMLLFGHGLPTMNLNRNIR